MEIKVFNSELTYLGVVDNFESIKFVAKYSQCGNFTIKAALTKQTNTYFKVVKSKFVCKLPSSISVDNYAARRAACSSAIRCR